MRARRRERIVSDRQLVEERQVPDVHIDGPQQERDHRTRHSSQRAGDADVQKRLEHRPCEPEYDQQRGNIPDDDVLNHVSDQDLIAERVERRELYDREHRRPADKRNDAPDCDRSALARERARRLANSGR